MCIISITRLIPPIRKACIYFKLLFVGRKAMEIIMKKTVLAILAAIICATIYYLISYISAPATTISAYTVTYEEISEGDAFIVRDETVYTAGIDGTSYSFAREGSRVGRDRRIMSIYSGRVDEIILQELGTLNEKILEESSHIVDSSEFTQDSGSMEGRLAKIYEEILKAASNNDVKRISELKNEIGAVSSGGVTQETNDELTVLIAERDKIERELGAERYDVLATGSGIYSTEIDGYENVLNMENAKKMTVADFAEIKPEEERKLSREDKKKKVPVIKGDKVCKTIDNHEWYVMALVNKEDIADVKKGDSVDVRFEKLPGEQITATVESISDEAEKQKKCVVLLKCESFSEGAFSIRWSGVEIIKNSYSGFEIPVSAVRVNDGQSGVMVRQGAKEIFKPCDIIFRNEEKAIVKVATDDVNRELRPYDMIVVGEK